MIAMIPRPLVTGTYCGCCQHAEKDRCRLGIKTVLMEEHGMFPMHKCDRYIYEPGSDHEVRDE